MYRKGRIYDLIDDVIYNIYIDYGISEFPISAELICEKMGIELIPYSVFHNNDRKILEKYSSYGFFSYADNMSEPMIFYNDDFGNKGAERFTIFHELKHYIYNDKNDENDDLADHFSKHFMCPTPYLLLKEINTPEDVVEMCNVSYETATNVSDSIVSRKNKYGYGLFEYEVKLINHLEPDLFKKHKKEVITK